MSFVSLSTNFNSYSKNMTASAKHFRDTFKVSKEIINWYPGHMRNSFLHMKAKMRSVDCVIEIHDSRVPFSGRNPLFMKNFLGSKPHILVLNKVDLIERSSQSSIRSRYLDEFENNVIFTNCLSQRCRGLRRIVPTVVNLIKESSLEPKLTEAKMKVMVVGIPNVGKSSLINALRSLILKKGKATSVGAVAGVTKSVQNEIKINVDPDIYLIDTPGILLPSINDIECGMKLALCSCLNDDVVGSINIADFLLYWMNKTKQFHYVKVLNIKEPVDCITNILVEIAVREKKSVKIKNVEKNIWQVVPDLHFAASKIVSLFRHGYFGDLNLDELHF